MNVDAGSYPGPKTGIRVSELSDLGQHFLMANIFSEK
jgi:hypothetical protein